MQSLLVDLHFWLKIYPYSISASVVDLNPLNIQRAETVPLSHVVTTRSEGTNSGLNIQAFHIPSMVNHMTPKSCGIILKMLQQNI